MGPRAEGGMTETRDLTLDAADVSHDCAGFKMGGDLLSEWDNAVHGRGDENQVSILHSGLSCIGDGVAPSLFTKCEANFGSTRPEHDVAGGLSGARGERSGSAEQSGSEDGEGRRWHDDVARESVPVISCRAMIAP